jgi:phosphotransacetylase
VRGAGASPAGLTVVDPGHPDLLARNVEEYLKLRQERGRPVPPEAAAKSMACPLAASAMMVRRQEAEVGVGGNLSATADVLRAGLAVLPKKKGIKTISSFFS